MSATTVEDLAKVSPESLGLRAPIPKVKHVSRGMLMLVIVVFFSALILSLILGLDTKRADTQLIQPRTAEANQKTAPETLFPSKVKYDSLQIEMPKPRQHISHDSSSSTQLSQHSNASYQVTPGPMDNQARNEHQQQLQELQHEAHIQALELAKQALRSDLELISGSSINVNNQTPAQVEKGGGHSRVKR